MLTDMTADQFFQQALARHRAGEYGEAEAGYRAFLEAQPVHAVANHNLGILLVHQNRAADSLSYFVSALEADPAQGQYWLNYIDALFQAGQQEEARQTLMMAREHGLEGAQVEALAERLVFGVAQQQASMDQRAGPDKKDIDDLLLLFGLGKYEQAANLARSMVEKFPDHEFGWKGLGVAYKEQGRIDEALEPMQRAAALSPGDVEAHYNMGVVLQALRRLDDAEESYREALRIDPEYADAHFNLGAVLHKAGRLQETQSCFARVLEINPDHVVARYNLGNVQQEMGKLADSAASYRCVLQMKPDHAGAHCSLGAVLMELDRSGEAEMSFRQAIKVKPDHGEAYFGLGRALKAQGHLEEAEAAYRHALQLSPDNAPAHYNLGNVLKDMERMDEAEASYRQAIQFDSSIAHAYYNLGNILFDSGRLEEAEKRFRQAVKFKSDHVEALCNLGMTLQETGRLDEAEVCYQQAIKIKSDFADAFLNQGLIYFAKGCFIEAEAIYRQALQIKPEYVEAHASLGAVLKEIGRLEDSEASLRRALQIKPDYAAAHSNLGFTLHAMGRSDDAEASLRRALQIKPDYAEAHCGLGVIFYDKGRIDVAEASFRQALKYKPDYVLAHSNLIFILDMMAGVDISMLQEERRRWEAVHAAHLRQEQKHANDPDPERRLRIGYVSADFRKHSAAYVFGNMLVNFDCDHFDVIAYSNSRVEDELTRHFQQTVTHWRRIAGLPDDAVAEMIRQDGIDILVDLSGHSAGNRLLVFARKPAPIQITAWGYAHGTGMSAMDVFFTDAVSVPPEEKRFYREQIRYLPSVVSSFFRHASPPVNELPALSAQRITFSSFNRLSKNSQETYQAWIQILQTLPDSRMVIKEPALDAADTRVRVMEYFTSAGIAPERIILLGYTSREDHQAAFNQIDIALDPFPHGGGVSTLDSMMMGVPVVTLNWPTLAGRLSSSILITMGLADWIAETSEQYVELAVKKAQDLQSLSKLRGQLRTIFTTSIVGDQDAYVRAVEQEYRTLWREWCKKLFSNEGDRIRCRYLQT